MSYDGLVGFVFGDIDLCIFYCYWVLVFVVCDEIVYGLLKSL